MPEHHGCTHICRKFLPHFCLSCCIFSFPILFYFQGFNSSTVLCFISRWTFLKWLFEPLNTYFYNSFWIKKRSTFPGNQILEKLKRTFMEKNAHSPWALINVQKRFRSTLCNYLFFVKYNAQYLSKTDFQSSKDRRLKCMLVSKVWMWHVVEQKIFPQPTGCSTSLTCKKIYYTLVQETKIGIVLIPLYERLKKTYSTKEWRTNCFHQCDSMPF